MTAGRLFTLVGIAAFTLGAVLWLGTRQRAPEGPRLLPPAISGPALYAASFQDAGGSPQPLGRFQDKLLVVNFWATWCAPCREEMPAFERLQGEWQARGVQFLGLSAEPAAVASRYGTQIGIRYPLWTGGESVMELSRRLGNADGVLPHTVVLAPGGRVVAAKVGAYKEAELAAILAENVANRRQ